MPSVLAATFPSLLGRMLEMPLSVLLCALEMCFLTVNHTQTPATVMPMPASVSVSVPLPVSGPGSGPGPGPGPGPVPVPASINATILRIGLPQETTAASLFNASRPHAHHVQHVPRVPHTTDAVTEPPTHRHPSSMTDRLDAINMDMVLKNTRLVNNFVKCMLDKGPCTAEGREMKREILEVLHTGCSKCSYKTKTRLKKTYRRMVSDPRMRESYKKVLNKYDPNKRYISNLEKFLIN